MGAYETAAAGGRHAGYLENYAGKSTAEIERGIGSIEKQVAQHESWIEDPYSKIADWDNLDPRQQDALINRKWPGDIQRQREQSEILRRILEGRG